MEKYLWIYSRLLESHLLQKSKEHWSLLPTRKIE
jgi:hypothetical protein